MFGWRASDITGQALTSLGLGGRPATFPSIPETFADEISLAFIPLGSDSHREKPTKHSSVFFPLFSFLVEV